MSVATQARRFALAALVIAGSVLGTAAVTAASAAPAGHASPAATAHATHVLADGGPNDTPWG
ncbi:MAG TPA: hypothetical protein VH478_12435 [Trebonia sp.]|jgi:hypothetical protein|nr:hypothetical protein [Trebonia sp.]